MSSEIGLRARYVHRVGPGDVGSRVSVRSRQPDGGVADRVGRLVAADDELLLLVDRDAQLHVLPVTSVLASRVVPAHPRRPAEPAVGTRDAPLRRQAARLLLLDPQERILLVRHRPGEGRAVWTAPGGGLAPGEDHAAAARREAREELGIELAPGPVVWTRRTLLAFRGAWLDQDERWLLTHAPAGLVLPDRTPDPATDLVRWWTLDALTATDDQLAPAQLAVHLATLLRDGPPATPIDVGS